jgi:hypothetical protein
MQYGGVVYNLPAIGTFGPITGANNGLSQAVTGKIVLGNDAGGSLATLLSNREIPLNNFSLTLTNIGLTGNSTFNLRDDPGRAINTGQMIFQTNTAAEQGRITMNGSIAGDAGDIFMGRLAGNATTNIDSRMYFGWRSGELATNAATGSTAFGYETLRLVTGVRNNAFGSQALHNISSGADNIGIGFNCLLFADILTSNIAIGNFSGPQVWAGQASNNNIFIGTGAGLTSASVAFVATGNTIIGNTALQNGGGGYGNNNVVVGFAAILNNSIGANCNIIGANIVATAAITNTTIIGQGISTGNSNVAIFGRTDQNVVLAQIATTDTGAKVQHGGVTSYPIRTAAGATTLTATDSTVITTGTGIVVTIPGAGTSLGWIFYIINQGGANTFSANYINFAGAAVNVIAANAVIAIQSNGANWQRLI